MEQEKNKNGVIALLVVIIVILLGLVILLATGTISFKEGNSINDGGSDSEKEIDSALLNNLYDVIGIDWEEPSMIMMGTDEEDEKNIAGDCLNYFLSDNNYKEKPNDYNSNAQIIFALYVSHIGGSTGYNIRNSSNCGEECQRQLSCADCNSIPKANADKIIKLYGLENLTLTKITGFDDEYLYLSNGRQYRGACHYKVTHDINSKYVDDSSIEINDKQVVTDYVYPKPTDGNGINSTKNQDVTYTFKKDTAGNYYLNSVIVK